MDINRENYTRSLENIRPSERFLAETKKLMLEEAAKTEKAVKPSRKPFIMKLTPFAAAAACIALIAVVGVNTLKDKSVETAQTDGSIYTAYAENNEESTEIASSDEADENKAPANDEADEADEALDEALSEESIADEAETAVSNEVPETEPSADEPAAFAVQEVWDGENADDSFCCDEAEMPASDGEEDTAQGTNGYVDGGFEYTGKPSADDVDTDGNAGTDTDDDICDDAEDINGGNKPVSPAFTKLSGGNALAYPDFLPTDTEKLREFLALASQDDINADVTASDGESTDIFGEKAHKLNEAFANAAEKLTQSGGESFVPTLSFSVFDNVSGDVLYTVQMNGSTVSVQIRYGETVYFTVDKAVIESIVSAAKW